MNAHGAVSAPHRFPERFPIARIQDYILVSEPGKNGVPGIFGIIGHCVGSDQPWLPTDH